MQIVELHKLRLENFLLKHILTCKEAEKPALSNRILKEARKTHHQLIKKKINNRLQEEQKLPEGANINAADNGFYTVTGLMREYGYFQDGFPPLYIKLKDTSIVEKPGHRTLKTWIRSLSVTLSAQYKKKYNELPPIGYGHTGKDVSIGSRNNLYKPEEENKRIIDAFMQERPEAIWWDIANGMELEGYSLNQKKPKNADRHKDRVEKYLDVKEYLPRRIKKRVEEEKQKEALQDLEDLLKKCRDELPKNKDMNMMFKIFKEKYGV